MKRIFVFAQRQEKFANAWFIIRLYALSTLELINIQGYVLPCADDVRNRSREIKKKSSRNSKKKNVTKKQIKIKETNKKCIHKRKVSERMGSKSINRLDFAHPEPAACRGGGDNDRSDKIKKRIACLTQIASSPHNHHGSHHSATGHYP